MGYLVGCVIERVVWGRLLVWWNGLGHLSLANTKVTIGSEGLLLLAEDTKEICMVSIPTRHSNEKARPVG